MDSRAPRLDRRTPRFLTVPLSRPSIVTRPKQKKDIPPGERLGHQLWPGFHAFPALGYRVSRDPFSARKRSKMSSAA